jgi:hypothetical protein
MRIDPPVSELLERSDHQPLCQDAMNHCHAASDDPGHSQRSVVPIHNHTPLHGTYGESLRASARIYASGVKP